MSLPDRLADVRQRIRRAAEAAGRAAADVTLIAVVKHQPLDRVLEAYDCGVRHFGDNTVQSLAATAAGLAAAGREATWHFIGRLQRNKVGKLLAHARIVHTVDRDELAEALARRASQTPIDVLVQVNIGRERQKGGVPPEEAVAFAGRVAVRSGLHLRGLMAILPEGDPPAPFFAAMAELRRALCATDFGRGARELSMGMSGDFEEAIAHGATMVRIGTQIFAERDAREGDPS